MDNPNDPSAVRRTKLWQTLSTLALAWGLGWSALYLIDPEGWPGDLGSWLGLALLVWGPLGALHAGRSWLGWYTSPE